MGTPMALENPWYTAKVGELSHGRFKVMEYRLGHCPKLLFLGAFSFTRLTLMAPLRIDQRRPLLTKTCRKT